MILNISQPYRPPWPVTGIALLLLYTPNAGGYNWATLFLGEINNGNLALQVLGVSKIETIKYDESCGTQI
jgi:hypothetical protein